ncbi:MAG: hypothetical protein JXJ04_23695 [Spirochaetales bacterium]|nr:hypothetical protein [Spirochaetales bacterium]
MEIKREEIIINKIAQQIITYKEGIIWFTSLEIAKQLEILRMLYYMLIQAGANKNDVNEAISLSKLKNTYTPCVLLQQGELRIQISKILNLPTTEYKKSFLLLISLFIIADNRRRKTECVKGCNHWWHGKIEHL